MDYKKLADLLYPNVKHDIDYYMQKYPKRDLPEGAEVVRFAPSPTGFLHLGSLSQCVINEAFARTTNGVFYMRLEDTDTRREIKDAGTIAYNALQYFGLVPNEGYRGDHLSEIGKYGPYVQSRRTEIYDTFAKYLVSIGRAFPCFCDVSESKSDILKRREEELETSDTIEGKDPCRNLTYEQIEQYIKEGKPFGLRLLSQGDINKTIHVVDLIKGERDIRENNKDVILIKGNGIPVYAFAHLVDDTLMGTTTVVRGEEWFQSLACHLELFDAFGLTPPKYAHTPVISKLDNETNQKRKLSKRKDPEANTAHYLEKGYPSQAVVEYLMTLANSNFEDWRKENPDKNYREFPFKMSNIGSNNPMFDFNKLNDISKNIIAKMSAETLYQNLSDWAVDHDPAFYEYINKNKKYIINVLSIDRGGEKPRKDIKYYSEIKDCFDYMFLPYSSLCVNAFFPKVSPEKVKGIMHKYAEKFDKNQTKEEWFEGVKALGLAMGFAVNNKEYKANPDNYLGNIADLCKIIRVCITGKENTPDLYSICVVLGKEELQDRVKYLVSRI